MAILPIIEVPDNRLRLVSEPVPAVDDEVRQLVADMFETMYAAPGIGLAAIQVAIPKRVLVIDLQERPDIEAEADTDPVAQEELEPVRNPRAFINPEILETSEEMNVYNEGCLSIPDQFAEIERPATCRVRWLDERGDTHEEVLDGLLATCLQHEMDHLNGVLFIDHISRLKRQMLMKRLDKARRAAA